MPIQLGASLILFGSMSKYFRPWKIDQPQLLPPSVRDFVPRDHLSRFIVELVRESLDLTEITSSYTSALGQPPFDPRLMVALLLNGYPPTRVPAGAPKDASPFPSACQAARPALTGLSPRPTAPIGLQPFWISAGGRPARKPSRAEAVLITERPCSASFNSLIRARKFPVICA